MSDKRYTRTSKTVRIRGIKNNTPNKASIDSYAQRIHEQAALPDHTSGSRSPILGSFFLPGGSSRSSGALLSRPIVSLASQGSGRQTATITFPSRREKENALLKARQLLPGEGWTVDDTLDGLTVLHDPGRTAEVDIVAVHGLNGNAFDTFAWEGYQMWLRDFLPESSELGRATARAMTFGYSSRLMDDGNISGLEEWSTALLREVSSVRLSEQERSRPLLLVAHSLGGLVVRQAMIELDQDQDHHRHRHQHYMYPGLSPRHCGILFLATPQSGATPADWNPYLTQLSELVGVRGRDFSALLGAFNDSSRTSKGRFGKLSHVPPFECLYETRKMKVGWRKKIIVTKDSAGLNSVTAQAMADVTHTEICRFPSDTQAGYLQVVGCLVRIRDRISAGLAEGALPGPAPAPLQHQNHQQDQPLTVEQPEPLETASPNPTTAPEAVREDERRGANAVLSTGGNAIESGRGTGGSIIIRENDELEITGGHATGASMSLADLRRFRGTVKGGVGEGAKVST